MLLHPQVDVLTSAWTLMAPETCKGFKHTPVSDTIALLVILIKETFYRYVAFVEKQRLAGVSQPPSIPLELSSELCGQQETCFLSLNDDNYTESPLL